MRASYGSILESSFFDIHDSWFDIRDSGSKGMQLVKYRLAPPSILFRPQGLIGSNIARVARQKTN